jgi:hypothetical protein
MSKVQVSCHFGNSRWLCTQTPENAASVANIHIEWDFRLVCWQTDLSFAESFYAGSEALWNAMRAWRFTPSHLKLREEEPENSTVS